MVWDLFGAIGEEAHGVHSLNIALLKTLWFLKSLAHTLANLASYSSMGSVSETGESPKEGVALDDEPLQVLCWKSMPYPRRISKNMVHLLEEDFGQGRVH